MTAALAGRIAVTVILIIVCYALLMVAAGRFLAWLGRKYPRVYATPEEYYGVTDTDSVDYFPADDDEAFHLDEDVQPHHPRDAA